MGIQEVGLGWFLEYQDRDVEHYHLLMDEAAMQQAVWPDVPEFRKVTRRSVGVQVLTGQGEDRIVSIWLECMGDFAPETLAFNRGGILERLANPERCHHYLANYVRKLSQKTLPEGFEPPGRWWWLSDRAKPRPRDEGFVGSYPYAGPIRLLRDLEGLEIIGRRPAASGLLSGTVQ